MNDALIGHSGFVGSTLLRQRAFPAQFRSSDIDEMRGQSYGTVVCAGAPAQKWLANKDPEGDLAGIQRLMDTLSAISCERFILISTVDVFKSPIGVNESSTVDIEGLHPYGMHRRMLESHVESLFSNHLIVRLPGLVGPGLRKNVIYDLRHDNNVGQIDSRGVFQFYPMVNLWFDIELALNSGLKLLHLTAEPISVENLAEYGFGRAFHQPGSAPTAARYDMQTIHSQLWGQEAPYQYPCAATLLAVRAYAQSELGAND